jgi:catechol 2,3-dioxygenase-like lactoylglutathione lyase family enzyme
MKENFLGLAHICIYTADLKKSEKFYTELLFFSKVYETVVQHTNETNINYLLITLGNCTIELLETKNQPIPSIAGIIDHIAIQVKNIEMIVNHLKGYAVTFKTEIFDLPDLMDGCKGCFIYGPSGELIELFEI